MADLIPFPRLMIDPTKRFDPQAVADLVMGNYKPFVPHPCANGMPGHPPCRSPAEMEAMLAQRQALAMVDMEPDDVEGT